VGDGLPAILISKNPEMLAGHLARQGRSNVIVHATITGLGGSSLEPNVPPPTAALRGFAALVSALGPDRVVLRVDPVIPNTAGVVLALGVIRHAQRLAPATRVRVSFLDLYPHVRRRLALADVAIPGGDWSGFHAPLEHRRHAWDVLGRPEVCGEPGFECAGCLSERDCTILGVKSIEWKGRQRAACGCLAQKVELLNRRGPCR
jgi:DNA repair photolyase